MKAIETKHLSEQLGHHMCKCGEPATRLIRCKTCRSVVARCGGCARETSDMERAAREHCAGSATR